MREGRADGFLSPFVVGYNRRRVHGVFMQFISVIMKKILLFALLCMAVGTAQAQTDQFTVYVEGLTCPICSGGLETKFKAVKGIAQVKADFKTGKMFFVMPPKYKMQMSEVKERVAKAGYAAKGILVRRSDGKTEKWGELKAIAPPATGPGS